MRKALIFICAFLSFFVLSSCDNNIDKENEMKSKTIYTVTFMNGNQVVGMSNFDDENYKISYIPNVPQKTGYTGVWENYTLSDNNIIINAIYTPIVYTASFKVDSKIIDTVDFTIESKSLSRIPTTPEKTGYTGVWENYTLSDNNIIINAIYTPIVYTATFKADSKIIDTVDFTVESKSLSRIPTIPEKTGYTGVWENYTLSDNNIIINAIYTPIVYQINYHLDGGLANSLSVTNFTIENNKIFLYSPTKDYYYFKGWYTYYDGNNYDGFINRDEYYTFNNHLLRDIDLYAKWEPIAYRIYISYIEIDGNKSIETGTNIFYYKSLLSNPNNPVYSYTIFNGNSHYIIKPPEIGNYLFIGYKTYPDYGFIYPTDDISNILFKYECIILTACYREYFNISYELNGGKYGLIFNIPLAQLRYDDSFNPNDSSYTKPQKNGFTFEGWFLDKELSIKADTIENLSSDLVLYAKWS